MKVTTEIIKNLNPCIDRLEHYLEHYSDFDGTIEDFLALEMLTHNDKIWVSVRLMSKEQRVKFSILCAKSVLHIFEEKYPEDKRPRLAIEAAEKWLLDPSAANATDAAYAALYAGLPMMKRLLLNLRPTVYSQNA